MSDASKKIGTLFAESKQFGAEVKDNASGLKNLASTMARKEIKFNMIEKISRIVYTNPNHLIKVEFIQYIMFVVLLYIYNPFDINTKYPVFTKLLVLIVAFVYVILFFFIRMKVEAAEDVDLIGPTEKTVLYQFISTILCFVLFMFTIKGVIWLFVNTDLLTLIRNMFGLILFIGILGIGYLAMKKTIDKAKNAHGKSVLKLLLKIIMYLPCLMVDIAESIKFQFHLTTKPVWILCGIEASILAVWFIIPIIFNKIVNLGGVKLLNEPINLDVETTLSNFTNTNNPNDLPVSLDKLNSDKINAKAKEDIDQTPTDTLNNVRDLSENYIDQNVPKNKYLAWIYYKIKNFTWFKVKLITHPSYTDYSKSRFSYTYALSGWFYLNPQPPSTSIAYTTYTNILNYGKKINIEYNGKLNSLRVMAAKPADKGDEKNMSTEVYKTSDIMYQKWNNFVINYDDGAVDVFLNGVLVASVSGIMPFMSFDDIVVGSDNGVMGGVCNVNYYKKTLAEKTIRMTYRSLRIKEFPYVGTIINTNIKFKKGKKDERFMKDMKQLLGGA
jgi:hypothetical protein